LREGQVFYLALMKKKIKGRLASKIIIDIVMIVICLTILMPFLWTIATSLRLPQDSFKLPPQFIPTTFYITNYIHVFQVFPLFAFLFNSLTIAIITTVSQCLFTTMAGYAFARIDFKGRNIVFLLILSGIMIPSQSIIIPQFLFVRKLGLMDTQWALILPALIFPMGIFLVRQFMMTIPKSYDEAAKIDGAGRFRVFWSIILPMSVPSVAVVAVMSFVTSWNNFFAPLIYLSTWNKMTLPLGLMVLEGFKGTGSVSVILAGVVISFIPPILIFIFGQKYLLQGTTLSGLKS
jgi:multiple sugar transport system permease protein